MLNPNSSTRSLGFSLCNCFAIQIPSQARNDINFSFANVMQIFFQKMHVMLNLIQHLSIHRFRVKPGMTQFFICKCHAEFFQKIKVMLNSNLFTRSLGFSIYFIRRFRVKLGMTQFFYKFGTTQFFTDFEPVFGTLFSESRENTRTRKPR